MALKEIKTETPEIKTPEIKTPKAETRENIEIGEMDIPTALRENKTDRIKETDLFSKTEAVEEPAPKAEAETEQNISKRFNEELETLTAENANSKIFNLGSPSNILLDVGIENKPIRLYGNKIIAKAKKHGFNVSDFKDLPEAVNTPIAIFEGSHPDSFAILTEITIKENNLLAIIETGDNGDIDFNIVTSAYPKTREILQQWTNDNKLLYEDKKRSPAYFSTPAPIAGAINKQETSGVSNNNIQQTPIKSQGGDIDLPKNVRVVWNKAHTEKSYYLINEDGTMTLLTPEEVSAMQNPNRTAHTSP